MPYAFVPVLSSGFLGGLEYCLEFVCANQAKHVVVGKTDQGGGDFALSPAGGYRTSRSVHQSQSDDGDDPVIVSGWKNNGDGIFVVWTKVTVLPLGHRSSNLDIPNMFPPSRRYSA